MDKESLVLKELPFFLNILYIIYIQVFCYEAFFAYR